MKAHHWAGLCLMCVGLGGMFLLIPGDKRAAALSDLAQFIPVFMLGSCLLEGAMLLLRPK